MIALVVMTDGRRDCISQAIPTTANLAGHITRRIIHDDSGDPQYRDWLATTFPTFELIGHPAGRQGFGGAYRNAWRFLASITQPFILSTEDDFTFDRPVDLDLIAMTLVDHPYLAQMAFRRQPWNAAEHEAGGVVEQHPDDFTEVTSPSGTWLEHRRFWTTNPHMMRRAITRRGWPDGAHSEGTFTAELFADPDVRCGYWGALDSGTWVTHVGQERIGAGY